MDEAKHGKMVLGMLGMGKDRAAGTHPGDRRTAAD
jgi:hypothetical protein